MKLIVLICFWFADVWALGRTPQYRFLEENVCPKLEKCHKEPGTFPSYACFSDAACPNGYSCCPHGCFTHDVCIKGRKADDLWTDKCPQSENKCLIQFSKRMHEKLECKSHVDCLPNRICCDDACSNHKICKQMDLNDEQDGDGNYFPFYRLTSNEDRRLALMNEFCPVSNGCDRPKRSEENYRCEDDTDCASGLICCSHDCYNHKICSAPVDSTGRKYDSSPSEVLEKPLNVNGMETSLMNFDNTSFCPALSSCDSEPISDLQFKCLIDENCAYGVKCCQHSCYQHNVCLIPVDIYGKEISINNVLYAKPKESMHLVCPKFDYCPIKKEDLANFKCFSDDVCRDGFKCCQHSCYFHKVCLPAVKISLENHPSYTGETSKYNPDKSSKDQGTSDKEHDQPTRIKITNTEDDQGSRYEPEDEEDLGSKYELDDDYENADGKESVGEESHRVKNEDELNGSGDYESEYDDSERDDSEHDDFEHDDFEHDDDDYEDDDYEVKDTDHAADDSDTTKEDIFSMATTQPSNEENFMFEDNKVEDSDSNEDDKENGDDYIDNKDYGSNVDNNKDEYENVTEENYSAQQEEEKDVEIEETHTEEDGNHAEENIEEDNSEVDLEENYTEVHPVKEHTEDDPEEGRKDDPEADSEGDHEVDHEGDSEGDPEEGREDHEADPEGVSEGDSEGASEGDSEGASEGDPEDVPEADPEDDPEEDYPEISHSEENHPESEGFEENHTDSSQAEENYEPDYTDSEENKDVGKEEYETESTTETEEDYTSIYSTESSFIVSGKDEFIEIAPPILSQWHSFFGKQNKTASSPVFVLPMPMDSGEEITIEYVRNQENIRLSRKRMKKE